MLYRPLQRPYQERIVKNLRIAIEINGENSFNYKSQLSASQSAQFQFRLVESGDLYARKCSNKFEQNVNKSIQRSYTNRCWPNGRSLFGLPSVGPPSDVVGIERIDLDLGSYAEHWLETDEYCRCLMKMVSKMLTQTIAFIVRLNEWTLNAPFKSKSFAWFDPYIEK